jgi:hypothetical protein
MQMPYCLNEVAAAIDKFRTWQRRGVGKFKLFFITVGLEDFISQTTTSGYSEAIEAFVSVYEHLIFKNMNTTEIRKNFNSIDKILTDPEKSFFKTLREFLNTNACSHISKLQLNQKKGPDIAKQVIRNLKNYFTTADS